MSKGFPEAGKKRLAGDTARQATAPEVKELRSESVALNEVVAELTQKNRPLKKNACSEMGAATNEKCCLREVGNHPYSRRLAPPG